jgi:hypothetical protein
MIDVLTIFSRYFRGEMFLFSLSKMVHGAGMCISKERLISINGNKTHQRRKI